MPISAGDTASADALSTMPQTFGNFDRRVVPVSQGKHTGYIIRMEKPLTIVKNGYGLSSFCRLNRCPELIWGIGHIDVIDAQGQ